MAEFRKLFYALGFAAMLTGVTSVASAQTTICTQIATPAPIIREESFAELVGEFALDCTGGLPTPLGQDVPRVNITVSLSTNITSKILATNASAGNWSEALLIVDDPNSASHPTIPLLACGQAGAPDTGPSGLGICSIISSGNADQTYSGVPLFQTVVTNGVGAATACTTAFGCGHPNVFQGRQGTAQITGNTNTIVFGGVPFDPPGNAIPENSATEGIELRSGHRILRITNIRANSPPVSGGFLFQTVIMEININANNISVTDTTRTVAAVNRGLLNPVVSSLATFVQCQARTSGSTQAMSIRFREGFLTSFKPKSLEQVMANGLLTGTNLSYNASVSGTTTTATTSYGTAALRQNIPGLVYNTESGFTARLADTNPTTNPPTGFNYGTSSVGTNGATISNTTNIAQAGIATQGTRIAVTFRDIPNGTTLAVPSIVYLYPAGSGPLTTGATPAAVLPTGVAVRTTPVSARGDGPYLPPTVLTGTQVVTGDIVVYEILYSDPSSVEDLYIPFTETHSVASLASDLPEVAKTAQVSGGFAPFILATDSASVWGQAQRTLDLSTTNAADAPTVGSVLFTPYLPVPRFRAQSAFVDLYRITKCACNLLFPFVTNAATSNGNFDTGIAIANTSLTPGAALFSSQRFGFSSGNAQDGPVQFWYYPANATDPPVATQCTNITATGVCPGTTQVKAGETLLYVLSQSSTRWGLRAAPGFTGYMIAQASFQYCHAFAYISPQGAFPLTNGMSVGYLALQLDGNTDLNRRTSQAAESLSQ